MSDALTPYKLNLCVNYLHKTNEWVRIEEVIGCFRIYFKEDKTTTRTLERMLRKMSSPQESYRLLDKKLSEFSGVVMYKTLNKFRVDDPREEMNRRMVK